MRAVEAPAPDAVWVDGLDGEQQESVRGNVEDGGMPVVEALKIADCAGGVQDRNGRRAHQQWPFKYIAVCAMEDLESGVARQAQDVGYLEAWLYEVRCMR